MARFVFFGRLVPEKGFDTLFPFLRSLASGERPESFAVFGNGSLEQRFLKEMSHLPYFRDASKLPEESILEAWNSHQSGVIFFGHRNLSTISLVLESATASVMPSRFLETFGLSALESLSSGVPVVAPSKGGLRDFIVSDEYKISSLSKVSQILEKLCELDEATLKIHRESALAIAAKYSEDIWIEQVRKSFGLNIQTPEETETSIVPKKILLLSDFKGKVGGVETHLDTIAKALRRAGFDVKIAAKESKNRSFFNRAFSIVYSFCNIAAHFETKKIIREFQPDIIWCHSVLRRIGNFGLSPVLQSTAILAITYHDLGYFSPSAAATESEKSIPNPSFSSFWKEEVLPWKYAPFYTIAKYWKLRHLFTMLKQFQVHFVPSQFLVNPLAARLGSKDSIVVLPHFRAK